MVKERQRARSANSSGRSVNTRCPHCARPLADLDVSDDHIVSEALGGHSKVPACKPCNDALGDRLEGQLLRPDSMLTLLAQVAGTTTGRLRGEFVEGPLSGQTGSVDFRTGEHQPRRFVQESDNRDGTATLELGGSPQQLRVILEGLRRRHGAQVPRWDKLSDEQRRPLPPAMVRMALQLDLALVRQLVAKSGLCAGAWIWGDDFVGSELAGWLREVLDVRQHWRPEQRPPAEPANAPVVDQVQVDAAGLLDEIARIVPAAQPLTDTAARAGQVVFIPQRRPQQLSTVVVLTVLGWHLPGSLVAPYPLPDGREFPIAVRQPRGGPAELLDVRQLVLDAIPERE